MPLYRLHCSDRHLKEDEIRLREEEMPHIIQKVINVYISSSVRDIVMKLSKDQALKFLNRLKIIYTNGTSVTTTVNINALSGVHNFIYTTLTVNIITETTKPNNRILEIIGDLPF
jgi:hypothetical protein